MEHMFLLPPYKGEGPPGGAAQLGNFPVSLSHCVIGDNLPSFFYNKSKLQGRRIVQNAHRDCSAPVGRLAISVECFPVHNGPVIANRRKISKGG